MGGRRGGLGGRGGLLHPSHPFGNGFFLPLRLFRSLRLLQHLRLEFELCQMHQGQQSPPTPRWGSRVGGWLKGRGGGGGQGGHTDVRGCAGLAAPSASACADPPARTPRWVSAGGQGWGHSRGGSPPQHWEPPSSNPREGSGPSKHTEPPRNSKSSPGEGPSPPTPPGAALGGGADTPQHQEPTPHQQQEPWGGFPAPNTTRSGSRGSPVPPPSNTRSPPGAAVGGWGSSPQVTPGVVLGRWRTPGAPPGAENDPA